MLEPHHRHQHHHQLPTKLQIKRPTMLWVSPITYPNPFATLAAFLSSSEVDAFAAKLKRGSPLPSIEEKLRALDAALVVLEKPGISRAEVLMYSKIIDG